MVKMLTALMFLYYVSVFIPVIYGHFFLLMRSTVLKECSCVFDIPDSVSFEV